MIRWIVCLALMVALTSTALAAKKEYVCTSNAYLVESKEYMVDFDYKNMQPFEALPDFVPPTAAELFRKAQSLSIDATPSQIKEITSLPISLKSFGSLVTYRWVEEKTKPNYAVQVRTYKGCVQSIQLTTIGSTDPTKKGIYSFFQRNLVPTGSTSFKKKDGIERCSLRRVKHQHFGYSRDGQKVSARPGDIPRKATDLFKLLDSFNNNRERVEKVLGPAKAKGQQLSWQVEDRQGVLYRVGVDLIRDHCEKQLDIDWQDKKGHWHQLTRINDYKM